MTARGALVIATALCLAIPASVRQTLQELGQTIPTILGGRHAQFV